MRILVNSHPKNKVSDGGIKVFTEQLDAYLKSTGHQATYLSILGKKVDDGKHDVRRVRRGKSYYITLKTRLNTKKFFATRVRQVPKSWDAPIAAIRRLIEESRPDIVLLNGVFLTNWMIMKAAQQAGVPVVIGHHGLLFKELKSFTSFLSKAASQVHYDMEKEGARTADGHIFISQASKDLFEKEYGKLPRNKALVIPLPYNPVFAAGGKAAKRAKGKLRIGYVARWDAIKNHWAVLQLARWAKKQKLPWEFTTVTKVMGDHITYREDYLKEVKVLKTMRPDRLKRFYQSLDLVIVPSKYETFSGVVMEGLLLGKPVLIGPAIPWARAFKAHGVGDWVVDFSRPARVAARIQALGGKKPPAGLVRSIRRDNNPASVFGQHIKFLGRFTRP